MCVQSVMNTILGVTGVSEFYFSNQQAEGQKEEGWGMQCETESSSEDSSVNRSSSMVAILLSWLFLMVQNWEYCSLTSCSSNCWILCLLVKITHLKIMNTTREAINRTYPWTHHPKQR